MRACTQVAEIFLPHTTANHDLSLTDTVSCLPFVLQNVVKLTFEFLVGVVAATFALMCVVK